MISTLSGIFIGLIVTYATVFTTSRFLSARSERLYYSISLIPIALIYIGFCYYYGKDDALLAEWVGVIIFSLFSLLGQWRSLVFLVLGYLLHAGWDVLHELYHGQVGESLIWTHVPAGYAAFCLTYDLLVSIYVIKRWRSW